nr:Ig-like domain-containing protein [Neobacillus sp. Marseille-Q6967]
MIFNTKYLRIENYAPLHLLLLALFLLLLPIKALAEEMPDLTPPSVSIDNIKVVDSKIQINGKVTDNQTPSDQILLELYAKTADAPDQLIKSIPPAGDGTWIFSEAIPYEGNKLYLKATDKAAPTPNTIEVPVDNSRPYVKSLLIPVYLSKDVTTKAENVKHVDLLKTDDMTRVALNPTITIDLFDNDVIDNLNFNNPITVFSKNGPVNGTLAINAQKQIVYTLNNLIPSTTYYIIFNSSLKDDAGNSAYPIIKKYTTVSSTVYNAEWDNQPHGFYTTNVNTCGNCHSTHVSDNVKLEKPKKDYQPKNSNLENSYCMACHDGTTVAPLPYFFNSENKPIVSKHEVQTNPEHTVNSGSCTSCHNPHLTWTEHNPNLFKDHFVYQHEDRTDYPEGEKIGEVDSRIKLCETCHGTETVAKKDEAIAKTRDEAYKVLHYRKSTAAKGSISETGKVEDYDLCFSCHNSQKETEKGIADILKYYQQTDSKHIITAADGSLLNGSIPCAECHETHGSSNLKLLKGKLGHEGQETEFVFNQGNWDKNSEQEFCLKCHNGKTAIYGVTGKSLDPLSSSGHAILGRCSSCHGGQSESFTESAHAPKAAPKTASEPEDSIPSSPETE